MKLPILMCTET